jgi:hypothetical protein
MFAQVYLILNKPSRAVNNMSMNFLFSLFFLTLYSRKAGANIKLFFNHNQNFTKKYLINLQQPVNPFIETQKIVDRTPLKHPLNSKAVVNIPPFFTL